LVSGEERRRVLAYIGFERLTTDFTDT
jgi:hypothetical protein